MKIFSKKKKPEKGPSFHVASAESHSHITSSSRYVIAAKKAAAWARLEKEKEKDKANGL